MINVCKNCLRLNPLGEKKCHYCPGDCQEIASQDLAEFWLEQLKKKAKEEEDG